MAYIIGLDLGQVQDYSALAVVEKTEPAGNGFLGAKPANYAVRHLQRWPLGTPYPQIVTDVAAILDRPPLPGGYLVVDATGVGRAVVDLFRQALADQSRRPRAPAHLVPVVITAGFHSAWGAGSWHTPKKDLAGVLQVLMAQRRFTVANLSERPTLLKELQNFKVKVSAATGNETFESWRERDHDDMVFSVALPCWYGERVLRRAFRNTVVRTRPQGKAPNIVACSRSQLEALAIEGHRCLLIVLDDPTDADAPSTMPTPHKLANVLDTLTLRFADLDPAECQDRWNTRLPPWNKPPAELVMAKEHGKQLWACLLRKRDPAADVFVIVDNGDRRALSVAQGTTDALRLPRGIIYVVGSDGADLIEGEQVNAEPANKHVWELVKASRHTVVA